MKKAYAIVIRNGLILLVRRQGVPVWHLRTSGAERQPSLETRKAYGEMAIRIPEISKERVKYFTHVSRRVRAKIADEARG